MNTYVLKVGVSRILPTCFLFRFWECLYTTGRPSSQATTSQVQHLAGVFLFLPSWFLYWLGSTCFFLFDHPIAKSIITTWTGLKLYIYLICVFSVWWNISKYIEQSTSCPNNCQTTFTSAHVVFTEEPRSQRVSFGDPDSTIAAVHAKMGRYELHPGACLCSACLCRVARPRGVWLVWRTLVDLMWFVMFGLTKGF